MTHLSLTRIDRQNQSLVYLALRRFWDEGALEPGAVVLTRILTISGPRVRLRVDLGTQRFTSTFAPLSALPEALNTICEPTLSFTISLWPEFRFVLIIRQDRLAATTFPPWNSRYPSLVANAEKATSKTPSKVRSVFLRPD